MRITTSEPSERTDDWSSKLLAILGGHHWCVGPEGPPSLFEKAAAMFGSAMLETAIGVVFVYMLLSIIVSAAKELVESVLKKRAADLTKGVRVLLDDPQGLALARQVFEHPLICCLNTCDSNNKIACDTLPSYIPARSFALALMDVILPGTTSAGSGVSESLAPGGTISTEVETQTFRQFREAVSKIQNSKIRQALLVLVDAAGSNIRRVRENIEMWFDSAMERVSGRYRRWSQWIIFCIGLSITIGMNADTIAICKHLSQSEPRAKAIALVEKSIAENDSASSKNLVAEYQKLSELNLPIGWEHMNWSAAAEWPSRLLGWLLTSIAIALGAPFWFDVLSKFVNVRSTLKTNGL